MPWRSAVPNSSAVFAREECFKASRRCCGGMESGFSAAHVPNSLRTPSMFNAPMFKSTPEPLLRASWSLDETLTNKQVDELSRSHVDSNSGKQLCADYFALAPLNTNKNLIACYASAKIWIDSVTWSLHLRRSTYVLSYDAYFTSREIFVFKYFAL